MNKKIRTLAITIAIPVGIVTLTLSIFYAMSFRHRGKALAAKQGIPYPAVIAHRGLSFWAPEETRAAYLMAREIGADYLELDVQRTKDGILIALHDDTLERTTNVRDVFPDRTSKTPDHFTFSDLQKLDAGTWFNTKFPAKARASFANLKILRLEDVLDIASSGQNKPGIYLETKSPERYPGYEAEIVAMLKKKGWMDDAQSGKLIFQSFAEESLIKLRKLAPHIPRVLLVDHDDVKKLGWQHFVDLAVKLEADLGPAGYEGWPWFTGPAHRAGRVVHVYTINESWQFRILSKCGVDGYFTDRSDLGLEIAGRDHPDRDSLFKTVGY